MVSWRIPLYKIYWDENDVKRMAEVIRSGAYWATGSNLEKLENMVAQYAGRKYAIAFNSGTSALHAILLAYKVKDGCEIIVPSFTFIATANSALFVNAKPIFADVEEETLGLDPEDVKERITTRTGAIIPVHYGGCACRIRELKEIAEDYSLLLIEDAAESIGAKVKGQLVGSFGDAAMFSFCGNKIVTTGEGGVVVTDSKRIRERLMLIRSHGRLEVEDYFSSVRTMDYVTLGYNWRMSNIVAALGISQFGKLDKLLRMRRNNASYMTGKLSKISGIAPPNPPDDYFHVYQLYTIRVKGGEKTRDDLRDYLARNRIMSKVYFLPVHLTSFYRKLGYGEEELPLTENLSRLVLSLPMYPSLKKHEMDFIVSKVKRFMSGRER